jgi:hypothetical protein
MNTLIDFMIDFSFNLLVALVVVRCIYYPLTRNKNYVFTFLAFNTIIYFVLSFMTSIELSVGVGFGLFAIFSVLRYRTDPIPIREMTYLFIIAALPVMNSSAVGRNIWPELLIANGAIIAILFMLEREWGFQFENSKTITYEKIELIKPENRQLLLADLQERTGLDVKRLEIGRINFLRDTAQIKIYFNGQQAGVPLHIVGGAGSEQDDEDYHSMLD